MGQEFVIGMLALELRKGSLINELLTTIELKIIYHFLVKKTEAQLILRNYDLNIFLLYLCILARMHSLDISYGKDT